MILNIFKKKINAEDLFFVTEDNISKCSLKFKRYVAKFRSEMLFSSPELDQRSSYPVSYVRQKPNVEHPENYIVDKEKYIDDQYKLVFPLM